MSVQLGYILEGLTTNVTFKYWLNGFRRSVINGDLDFIPLVVPILIIWFTDTPEQVH